MFEKYNHLLSKSPIGPVPCLIPETMELMKYLQPPTTHPRVIDVGAGQGSWTVELRKRGYMVFPFDMDTSQFPEAAQGDMHDLSLYGDDSYDQVFCTGSFEHAFAPYIVLSEFVRVIRDGGRILITLPSYTNEKMAVLPEHFTAISKDMMQWMYCTKLGMTMVKHVEAEWDPVVGPHQVFVMDVEK